MTIPDWLVDLALIGLVVLQLRGRRLTTRSLLIPVGLVVWAATKYLHGIPTAGHDLWLVVPCTLAGLALGAGAGWLTRMYCTADGAVVARATVWAAVLWVLGVGSRLAFQLVASHGGGTAIGQFSMAHQLDAAGWTTAIILMAFGEVLARTVVLGLRARTTPRPVGVDSARVHVA